MTRRELIKELEKLGVKYDTWMTKAQLEELLQAVSETTETEIVKPIVEKPEVVNNKPNSKYGAGKVFIPSGL